MTLSKQGKQTMVNVLKNKRFEEAYFMLTQRNWWEDNTLTNDMERIKYLYETFFDYYNLLFTEGINGIEKEEEHVLIHQLKLQLDKELTKVERSIYTE